MATFDGTWTYETKPNGTVVSAVTGRDPRPIIKKLSPIWWFYNSDDPIAPSEYMPGGPDWLRTAMWYARNPLHNLAFYVIGVADQDYSMWTKRRDPVAHRRSSLPATLQSDIGALGPRAEAK